MRKLLTFPINLVAFILAIPYALGIRVKERAIWMERKLDIFEENKGNKK